MSNVSDKKSTERLRGQLYAAIEAELRKDEAEIDYELIGECSALDAYLTDSERPLDDKTCRRGLKEIRKKCAVQGGAQKRIRKGALRAALIAAALLVLAFSAVTVVATSQGRSVAEFISTNTRELLGLGTDDGTVTLIDGERITEHACVEEAIEGLEAALLYPADMPKGVRIEEVVRVGYGDRDAFEIMFITNRPSEHHVQVMSRPLTDPTQLPKAKEYDVDGTIFYVWQTKNGSWRAIGHRDGMEYQLFSSTQNDLLILLCGMTPTTP